MLPFPIKGGKLYLYNNNPLLIYRYPGATGLKTGYTDAAGRCLVATAERDGVRLGVVLLNSAAPGTQARQLLDRGFQDVYHLPRVREPPMPAGRLRPRGRSLRRRRDTRLAPWSTVSLRAIDWPVSQRREPWISTTHPSRPRTAPRCAAGSRSTSPKRPSCRARTRSRTRTR